MFLGGTISPETREILSSGENPLLSRSGDSSFDVDEEPMGEMRERMTPLTRRNAPLPRLTGIAQVVGLALGSPEFQRR